MEKYEEEDEKIKQIRNDNKRNEIVVVVIMTPYRLLAFYID